MYEAVFRASWGLQHIQACWDYLHHLILFILFHFGSRTGFMYDERMLEYNSLHDPNYLDSPERISSIYAKCRLYGLVKRCLRLKVCTLCTLREESSITIFDNDQFAKFKFCTSPVFHKPSRCNLYKVS